MILPHSLFKESQTLLLIIGLAVNARSTKKEAAKRFVDFITNEEGQNIIRKETLSIPAHKIAKSMEMTYLKNQQDIICLEKLFQVISCLLILG